ncbi:MAG: hypothetical protein KatS3mg097_225 [Candidatus Parcubacteria bacterium]|nr:MAG: hypothetical protein KatS3mg097_225 [Candidatus Parcubacteria bacterium]
MKIIWTKHAEKKLRFYQLSKQRIIRIIKKPYRIEEGIAPKTIAMMQPVNPKNNKWKQEIWTMIQKTKSTTKIISAWRYPGISPNNNPIPADIIFELQKAGFL